MENDMSSSCNKLVKTEQTRTRQQFASIGTRLIEKGDSSVTFTGLLLEKEFQVSHMYRLTF